MTKQDGIKKVLKGMTKEDYDYELRYLNKLSSFAACECVPLSLETKAVMTKEASKKMEEFFDILKLDYKNDENLKDTPMRVASMYINELLVGRYTKPPRIESFPADMYYAKEKIEKGKGKSNFTIEAETELQNMYNELTEIESFIYNTENSNKNDLKIDNALLMRSEKILDEIEAFKLEYGFAKPDIETMVVKNIDVNSICSHHLISFVSTNEKESKCTIAYIPTLGSQNALLGISKLQRIGDWFGRRPQLQEELNWQIKAFISLILRSRDVMVTFTDIVHYCEKTRGVESHCGSTSSTVFSGEFKKAEYRNFALAIAK